MDDAQLKRRMEQQRQIQERLQDRERIQLAFARYGGDVCRIVWEELRRHQGLHQILQKLGMPMAPSFDQELEIIHRFISEQGPGAFVRQIRPHHDYLDWNLFEEGAKTPAGDDETVAIARRAPAGSAAPAASAARTADAATAGTPAGNAPGAKKESESPAAAGPAATTPSHWIDAHGKYIGPERRASGRDRRSGADRRAGVESISKNKRYGGDRRKSRGRRKTDPRS